MAPIRILSGLGGVGKTQLAAEYARTRWDGGSGRHLDLLVWVSATSRTAVVQAYAEAYRAVTAEDSDDPAQAAARFLAWLASTRRSWLIVLDDLTIPSDLDRLYPPSTPAGLTVVTTRRRDAALYGEERKLIDVDVFRPADAVAYLRGRLDSDSGETDEATGLAADLGYLPLALAQAAAFIIDRDLTCGRYRTMLSERHTRMIDLLPEPDARPDEHAASVVATWSLSIELANRLHPAGLARPMLDLVALFDPNGIPAGVLTAPAVLAHLTRKGGRPVDAATAGQALACLHRLNLVTVNPDEPAAMVRVHALVQRAARDQLTAQQITAYAHVAADALQQTWPGGGPDNVLVRSLRANAITLQTNTGEALWRVPASTTRLDRLYDRLFSFLVRSLRYRLHPLLHTVGNSLGEAGHVAAAAEYFLQLCLLTQQRLGPGHPNVLAILHNSGFWLGMSGDKEGAVAHFEKLSAVSLRMLDPDHPMTLVVRGNLALWQGEAGDHVGAVALYEQLLAQHLRRFGPDHPRTLVARANLLAERWQSGDRVNALGPLEQLLADRVRVLGPDHSDTLRTRLNLAFCRAEVGDIDGVVTAVEQVINDHVRLLGSDHRDTLTARSFLAYCQELAGDETGAVATLERLVLDKARVFGPDHPDTLQIRKDLALRGGEAGAAGDPVSLSGDLRDRGGRGDWQDWRRAYPPLSRAFDRMSDSGS